MLLQLLIFLPAAVVRGVSISAFGCDTTLNTSTTASHEPYFYPAARIAGLVGSSACPYLAATTAALGPCFVSPVVVKAALDLLPAGKRAISLEGTSLYDVQNASRTRMLRDRLP